MFDYLDTMLKYGVFSVKGLARGLATEFGVTEEHASRVVAAWLNVRPNLVIQHIPFDTPAKDVVN